jgi:hypothetical protein
MGVVFIVLDNVQVVTNTKQWCSGYFLLGCWRDGRVRLWRVDIYAGVRLLALAIHS